MLLSNLTALSLEQATTLPFLTQRLAREGARAGRDSNAVATALEKVRDAAAGGQNVMPAMMEAVKAYATLGEITKTLKSVFGEFREPVRL